MKLIVGLGNPGEKYLTTRHNLGFMVVDQFLKDSTPVQRTAWQDEKKFKSDIAKLEWQPKHGALENVILVKPKTFMNKSGMAVGLISAFYKIKPEDIWIVYDELDLPLGHMKIRFGGAAAGHHGVESIIETLGIDKFWRFRMGIGIAHNHDTVAKHNVKNAEDFVLGGFIGKDRSEIKKLIKHGSDALQTALEKGIDTAMNRFNTK
ncbi:MAG TPA: aminoacyl-tRNA hydrolase [Patescibacteria group bacterium]|nr:aminoacyl-tRNA hydrolase [Patescibacteria group bacterium]